MAIPFLNNVDLTQNQLLNAALQQIAGNHGSPVEGVIWYDSSAKIIKYFDGTSVRIVGDSSSGGDAETLNGQGAAYYLSRENHAGTQTAATISDFEQAVTAIASLASKSYVDDSIAALADSAPATLNTLNELAAALGDDANFAASVQEQLGQRTRKYAATIGDGAATSFTLTHGLNTQDVTVTVRQTASPYAQVYCDVEIPDMNTATLRFAAAPAADSYRAVVVG